MLRIAHRRDVWGDGELLDGLINIFSGLGGYCHTELLFSNGESFSSFVKFDRANTVYPAPHYYRPKGGPQIRKIDFKLDTWAYTKLPDVSPEDEDKLYGYCKKLIDESVATQGGYDRLGVLRFVLKFMKQSERDWFCTEAVMHVLQKSLGMFPDMQAWDYSPNRFNVICDRL